MQTEKKFKYIPFILIIFLIPFLEFLKTNVADIDIILGKSFFFLIFVLFFILLLLTYVAKFFFKKVEFKTLFLIVVICYWIFFKHNSLKISISSFFNNFSLNGVEYSSEISLLILIVLSIYFSILIYKKNRFFKKFIIIFFSLTFCLYFIQIVSFKEGLNVVKSDKKININFPDKLKNKKENIYFFILDAMQPIKEFEKYYKLDQKYFINYVNSKSYRYIHNTSNTYDNTTYSLSAFFYLDKIFDKEKKLKDKTKVLFPTLLRTNNKSDLINNLDNLGYDFKWLGNFFAYCPKFNLKYCLNKDENTIIDTYLYINFFRQTPLIQTIVNFGFIFDFDFNKYFFYKLNDGMGRLTEYLKDNKIDNKPTFYFIHHMSPHWPYITNKDCSYKSYPGNKNLEGYKSAYLCTLKKIQQTINFLNKFDPDSTVIFQSDHNWIMSKNQDEKRSIFNLIKINQNCKVEEGIMLNNVNTLRLIFSCMTGNNPEYIVD